MSEIIKSEVKILKIVYDREIPKTDDSGYYQGYRVLYKTKKNEEKKLTLPYMAIKNNSSLEKIKDIKVGDEVVFHWQDKSLVSITLKQQSKPTAQSGSDIDDGNLYQVRMIMQNAYRHAVNIAIHNSGKKELTFTDVRDLAHLIAKDVLESNLSPKVNNAPIIKTSEIKEEYEPELEDLPY